MVASSSTPVAISAVLEKFQPIRSRRHINIFPRGFTPADSLARSLAGTA